jgi:heme-degrading monooxygenase HmoA
MFAVIYRWKVVPGGETEFVSAWEALTHRLRDEAGALGSRLHRAEDGSFLAYAQWPDRQTWEAARDGPAPDEDLAGRMTAVVAERLEPVLLEVENDLLETRGWTWD